MSKLYLPLTDKGKVSNSIAGFVLNHPELHDIMDAYNQWAREEIHSDFPWSADWFPSFCLDIFSTCMFKMSRKMLQRIYYQEMRCLYQEDKYDEANPNG